MLGTDALASDRNNSRNLTPPAFDDMGQASLSFGRNPSAQFPTRWELYRSTDLISWGLPIYTFDGSNQTFNANEFSVDLGTNSITLIDKNPPFPKAFYQFRAVSP